MYLPYKERILCVIPARLSSSRLPRKMLAPLGEKTLLQTTYENACRVSAFSQVVIAVDHPELYEHALSFGAEVWMTSDRCESGTERLIELCASEKLQAEIWVNWQGDEPFIEPMMIEILLQSVQNGEEGIWTLRKKIQKEEELFSAHVPKVVCDMYGRALYFSRSPIPFSHSMKLSQGTFSYYKHIGIYAFRSSVLKQLFSLSAAPLERAESLEQLRFLSYGFPIQVHETEIDIFGINTLEDYQLAQKLILTAKSMS